MKKLALLLIAVLLLYALYPFWGTKRPFIIVGITPINVPTYEGFTFTKNQSSPQFKKAVKQYNLDKNVVAVYLPSNEIATPEKPFSTIMALSHGPISLPVINFQNDTHWKWERFAKQQFIKSYSKQCAVKWLNMTANSLSYACGLQSTAVLYVQNQIITWDFYTSYVNEDTNSFTTNIVNDFLKINNEKAYFEEESIFIYLLYTFIYISSLTLILDWCSRNRYLFILYNIGIVFIFLVLLVDDTYDGKPYINIKIDRHNIRMPHLNGDFELPDTIKSVNNYDEKSIIASISAKNNSDLYPLDIYFLSLNRVAPKTSAGRYSSRCDFDHCHGEDYWQAHFKFLESKLGSEPNTEIIGVRHETAVNKIFYIKKSEANHTDIVATSVLYLNNRVFEMSIVKPFKTTSDISTVMRIAEEVEESLLFANKLSSGFGNDANFAFSMAIFIAFISQFHFLFKKKTSANNQTKSEHTKSG